MAKLKVRTMTDLAVNINNVSMHYPFFDLKNVSMQVPKGSIMGLIGPNGAGKSTSIRIMMGLLFPDSGTVEVLGYNMLEKAHEARWKIGYVSEDMRLYKGMTIGWHMQFIKDMFHDWDEAYAKQLLQRFNLNPAQKLKGLSHGQRVKTALLLVLARHPDLLILDEPTTGLDPVARMETLDEMMKILMDEDRSIIFSSHNTADVEQLSDQITFIDHGQVVNSRDKESFLESWRRVRISLKRPDQLMTLNKAVHSQINGRSAVVTTNDFSAELLTQWQSDDIEIVGIDPMTLEEIFLAEVKSSRQGDNI